MHFYWVQDRVRQGQFRIHWKKGADNLANYFTKHHSPKRHRLLHSTYLHEPTPGKKMTNFQTQCEGVLKLGVHPSVLPSFSPLNPKSCSLTTTTTAELSSFPKPTNLFHC
jgi:hypothetical protein